MQRCYRERHLTKRQSLQIDKEEKESNHILDIKIGGRRRRKSSRRRRKATKKIMTKDLVGHVDTSYEERPNESI